jgi:lysozyme
MTTALSGKQKAGLTAAVIASALAAALPTALPIIRQWEGVRTTPYLDVAKIPTVCIGETAVQMRAYTVAECNEMLNRRVVQDFGPLVLQCIPGLATPARLNQLSASIVLAYNIGTGAFCKSTIARRFNAAQWRAGCDGFLAWRFAGGREMRGLLNRRQDERALCLRGLA